MSKNIFIFRITDPHIRPTSFLYTFICGDSFITPNVISSNWKWRDISAAHFIYLSHYSHPTRDLGKGATVHDHTCLYVHWFRWRVFWTFVVSCDWINNKNSTVTKLKTELWMYCVNCKWNVTQSRYFLLNGIFQLESKPLISGHMFIWTSFFLLTCRSHSWSLAKHFRYILYPPYEYINPQGHTLCTYLL
jgi:hypothetical protein